VTVVLDEGARDNGLALMLAQLVEENLREHPWKERDLLALDRLAVGIVAPDADVRLTMVFEAGRLTLCGGLRPDCDLLVRTDAERVARLSHLPVRRIGPLRLPDYLCAAGRRLLFDLVRGRLRVKGLLCHPLKVTRLMRLLSVNA
jgi:hypothetical protein